MPKKIANNLAEESGSRNITINRRSQNENKCLKGLLDVQGENIMQIYFILAYLTTFNLLPMLLLTWDR